jgi:hypothetical protein
VRYSRSGLGDKIMGETEKTSLIQRAINKVREINERYKTRKIKMSRGVKIAMLFLRLYLLFLVVILVYKFATTVKG